MENRKSERFKQIEDKLHCPLCKAPLKVLEMSLICESGHCFDISAKGYANLLPNQKPLRGYDKDFFECRSAVFEKGLYSHVLDAVIACVGQHNTRGADALLVDAGCGDGYYTRCLQRSTGIDVIGLDAAKEAILQASRGAQAPFIVADIANIPIADKTADFVLDAFSPANYAEFSRVLRDDGTLIKLVPTQNHMAELRHTLRGVIRNEEYSNERVAQYCGEHFDIMKSTVVTKTSFIDASTLGALLKMTPLMFGVDPQTVDTSQIHSVTVEALILVGKKKN